MRNDTVAMASCWEERLRPPKWHENKDPQFWAVYLPHLLTLTQKEKRLHPKATFAYRRSTTIRQKLTDNKRLALNNIQKQIKEIPRPCNGCAACGCHRKYNKSMVPCFSQIKPKNKHFPLNQTLHAPTAALAQWLVWQTINNMSARPLTNFPWESRTAVIEANEIVKMTKIKWPCHSTIQCSMASWINLLYMKLTLLILPNNPIDFHSLDSRDDKWYHQLDAQINNLNMMLPCAKYFLVSLCSWLTCFDQ